MVLPFCNVLSRFWRVGEVFVVCILRFDFLLCLFVCFFGFWWVLIFFIIICFLKRIWKICSYFEMWFSSIVQGSFTSELEFFHRFFSRRKGPCGKACGKCGSSENVCYVTQQGTETQGAVEKPAEWAVQWAVGKRQRLHLQRIQVLCPPFPPSQSCHCLRFKAKRDPHKSLERSHWPNMRSTKPSWISGINLWKYCLCFSRLAAQLELILSGFALTYALDSRKSKNLDAISIWIPVL